MPVVLFLSVLQTLKTLMWIRIPDTPLDWDAEPDPAFLAFHKFKFWHFWDKSFWWLKCRFFRSGSTLSVFLSVWRIDSLVFRKISGFMSFDQIRLKYVNPGPQHSSPVLWIRILRKFLDLPFPSLFRRIRILPSRKKRLIATVSQLFSLLFIFEDLWKCTFKK